MADERKAALERLRETIDLGDTIYSIMRHRSRSGMYRVVQLIIVRDNRPLYLGCDVATALGLRYDRRHEGIGVRGLDSAEHVVSRLSRALFHDSAIRHRAL